MSASQFPPLESTPSTKRCSNCSSLMSLYALPGHYGQTIDIDVCLDCNAIWFDGAESSQLSPDGVVALFQLIHERGGTASSAGRKLSEGLRCVSCGDGMRLVTDRVKNTRFVYQSCTSGHGRLTTFYNFLSEKQFVRELTQAERAKLSASVKQVQCSSCGAPVDLGKHDACSYCRAPVSVFDRDAAKKAIEHYLAQRQKQLPSTPPNLGYPQAGGARDGDSYAGYVAADLAFDLLWALGRVATHSITRTAAGGAAAGTMVGAAGGALADGSGLTNVPGGLMDTLHSGGGVPISATDALFGSANGLADIGGLSNVATSALPASLELLPTVQDALPSATDALFGADAASMAGDLFSSVSSGGAEIASGAVDAFGEVGGELASGLGESLGDVAASSSEGVVDLVSDGIGSLISSLFS